MRPTLRLRLTLVYGGLFLLAGMALLGVTYLLFTKQLTDSIGGYLPDEPGMDRQVMILRRDGETLTGEAAMEWMRRQQADLRDAATKSLLTQGAIALALVGAAAAASGWLVAGRMLAPLHRVTATARRIAAAPATDRSLQQRIDLHGPLDEVKELADTFDRMVERLDHAFDGQRRFVANASHELRTPLTLNRALVELAMHRRTASPDVIQLGESLLEINARHERLISGLLLLARADHEIADRSPVDLADVVSHVVAQTKAEAAEASVEVTEDSGAAPTFGDALLLERLVHNLVENGVRHNVPDGWVHVVSRVASGGGASGGGASGGGALAGGASGGGVELEVSNSGPVVPPYDVPALFEPFRRLGPERLVTAKGSGLGLSIVRSVARAHGGDVQAVPREGGGLIVTVRLPRAPG
ncbi:HAMP domain-containing sensor histidine kinase [Dactylosporangium sp. AC04546]|uniref:sensor histidine kinase n=1 Tax=Dactylosporangium sp. AC04546 TaxID=2862460 RepID=UPI001EDD1580|nr:HAMP domain-containing sensor histidine kinase [Dactylosporangium sp. AC04546]WVK84167.1 HAMP domain-containing sensor histidine kinase [Dactylosporangium sp. AC04546]